jgi:hypothetical protein
MGRSLIWNCPIRCPLELNGRPAGAERSICRERRRTHSNRSSRACLRSSRLRFHTASTRSGSCPPNSRRPLCPLIPGVCLRGAVKLQAIFNEDEEKLITPKLTLARMYYPKRNTHPAGWAESKVIEIPMGQLRWRRSVKIAPKASRLESMIIPHSDRVGIEVAPGSGGWSP